MSEVVLEISLVKKIVLIGFLPIATFLIIVEVSFIKSSITIFNDSKSMSLSIRKLPVIVIFVVPEVITNSTWQVVLEISCINLSILKAESTRAFLHIIFKFSFIPTSFLNQHSKTLNCIVLPLPYIRKTVGTFPNTTSRFFITLPLAIIDFSIFPLKLSPSFSLTLNKITEIEGVVRVLFISKSFFMTKLKVAFKYFAILIQNNAFSMFLMFLASCLSKVLLIGRRNFLESCEIDIFENLEVKGVAVDELR